MIDLPFVFQDRVRAHGATKNNMSKYIDGFLVVLGTRCDPHVDRVVSRIEARSDVRIFVMDYLNHTDIVLEVDERGVHRLTVDGVLLPEKYLVWDRVKILPGTELYIRGDERSSGYGAQEWRALYTLLCGLNKGNVVNPVEGRSCMIKPYQQTIAALCGFKVPSTIVSNSKASVRAFQRRSADKTIMKSLSAGKVKPAGEGEYIPYNVMTMRVTPCDVDGASEAEIAFCPHFLQREIEKSHELRVVVAGDRMLPFRIDSQSSRVSEVDWRKGAKMRHFAPCEIEDEIRHKIMMFMRHIGLITGSMDLIVDRAGDVWFLECNQDGAWGWLDDLCDGAVADMFAEELLHRIVIMESQQSEVPRASYENPGPVRMVV